MIRDLKSIRRVPWQYSINSKDRKRKDKIIYHFICQFFVLALINFYQMTLRNGLMRRRLKEQIRDQQKDTQRQFHDKAFDESKNRSMTSVSTLQELGSQMMEFYYNCIYSWWATRNRLSFQQLFDESLDCYFYNSIDVNVKVEIKIKESIEIGSEPIIAGLS